MRAGRPRQFDEDEALDRALRVFWRHGFEGSSLTDLTEAMGINKPSLYAAFGDKRSLFLRAVERYGRVNACHVEAALNEPTARRVIERYWMGGVEVSSDAANPRGCFLVQGALACGEAARGVQEAVAEVRNSGEAALRERFERAKREGDLPGSVDAGDLARYVAMVSYGLAVQAAGGASTAELSAVVSMALRSLP